jgi:hypothetical protein
VYRNLAAKQDTSSASLRVQASRVQRPIAQKPSFRPEPSAFCGRRSAAIRFSTQTSPQPPPRLCRCFCLSPFTIHKSVGCPIHRAVCDGWDRRLSTNHNAVAVVFAVASPSFPATNLRLAPALSCTPATELCIFSLLTDEAKCPSKAISGAGGPSGRTNDCRPIRVAGGRQHHACTI